MVFLSQLAEAWGDIASTRSRLRKIERLTELLEQLSPAEVPVAVAYLSGELPQGAIGVGWAALKDMPPPAGEASTLELLEVHAALDRVARTTGPGSQAARRALLSSVFEASSDHGQSFLRALLLGDLRQGALEGIMVEAVAKAAGVPAVDVRRAVMLAGDLGIVATAVLSEGAAGLARFRLTLLTPVQPMLAQTADTVSHAYERFSSASVEYKLDGARVQIHRLGAEVRIFTRNLADITGRVPEIVDAVTALPLDAVIFDGEAIALGEDGRPMPFQTSMSRFGSRLEVDELRRRTPLSLFLFDCLHLEGDDLIDLPAKERFEIMASRVPQTLSIRRIVTDEVARAERFLEEALAAGHEGVMVKSLDAPYEAGRRGSGWLKVKRAHTVDLVVLAAEWGHGRRRGMLSNIHLGARDPSSGGFVMLGKTFKGMTDEMLAWQTQKLLELETHREGITVFVKPELVVEVAFDGLQRSPRYPAGLTLRFARVRGYRSDKEPGDADTIDTVRAIGSSSFGNPE